MRITLPFAEDQEIDPSTIITFPDGIPGFEQCTRYKLFHEEGKPTLFWLQSVDKPELSLSVTQPEILNIAYQFALSDDEEKRLEISGPVGAEDLAVLVILYRQFAKGEQAGDAAVQANVRAPLVINLKSRIGLQKTLRNIETVTLYRAHD